MALSLYSRIAGFGGPVISLEYRSFGSSGNLWLLVFRLLVLLDKMPPPLDVVEVPRALKRTMNRTLITTAIRRDGLNHISNHHCPVTVQIVDIPGLNHDLSAAGD